MTGGEQAGTRARRTRRGVAALAAVAAVSVAAAAVAAAPVAAAPAGEDPRSGWFTTSDGVRLHYLEAGRGAPIVLVPGWTIPAEIWEPQLRSLSARHRVVALDPRSQGRSESPGDGHYPERRARDIAELIEHLEAGPVVLVGWSLGVVEALTLVDAFGTESIRGLALVDGYIGEDRDPTAPNPLGPMLAGMQRDRRAFAAGFVRSMYRTPRDEAYLERMIEGSLRTPTHAAVTLMTNLMLGAGDWRPELRKVDRPILYVVSGQLAAQAEMVRRERPDARVEVWDDAGHALFVDRPERFDALLEEWIAGL